MSRVSLLKIWKNTGLISKSMLPEIKGHYGFLDNHNGFQNVAHMVWNGFGLAYMQPVSNCCENHHPDHMLQHILLSIFLYQQHLGIYIHTYIYIHLIWLKTFSSSSLYRHLREISQPFHPHRKNPIGWRGTYSLEPLQYLPMKQVASPFPPRP